MNVFVLILLLALLGFCGWLLQRYGSQMDGTIRGLIKFLIIFVAVVLVIQFVLGVFGLSLGGLVNSSPPRVR